MADPPKRRVVASQPPPSTPSTSSARPRARVDPSSISTPSTSRPSLRTTPSTSSVSSRMSGTPRSYSPSIPASTPLAGPSSGRISAPITPVLRSRSPVPPPSAPTRTLSTPLQTPTNVRARVTPQRPPNAATQSTPASLPRVTARPSITGRQSGGIATLPSQSMAGLSSDRPTRAKVKAIPSLTTPSPRPPSRSSNLSNPTVSPSTSHPPHSAPLSGGSRSYPSQQPPASGADLARVTSHHSSPGKTATALPPYLRPGHTTYVQHPTSSCPSSPPVPLSPSLPNVPHASHHHPPHRSLPLNPHSTLNGFRANAPPSPEIKTVLLPIMTPRRTSEASDALSMSRMGSAQMSSGLSASGSEGRTSARASIDENKDRWSGSTAVDPNEGGVKADHEGQLGLGFEMNGREEGTELGVQVETPPEAGEADETADDMLMEDAEEAKINRKVADLEISNASLMAINRSLETAKAKQRSEILKLRRALRESSDGHPPSLGLTLSRPFLSPSGLQSPSTDTFEEDPLSFVEEDMDDPEIDKRWDKLQDLVTTMQRRAEGALKKGWQEIKLPQRVLDWTEVDRGEGEGGGEGEGDMSVDASTEGTPLRGSPGL